MNSCAIDLYRYEKHVEAHVLLYSKSVTWHTCANIKLCDLIFTVGTKLYYMVEISWLGLISGRWSSTVDFARCMTPWDENRGGFKMATVVASAVRALVNRPVQHKMAATLTQHP